MNWSYDRHFSASHRQDLRFFVRSRQVSQHRFSLDKLVTYNLLWLEFAISPTFSHFFQ